MLHERGLAYTKGGRFTIDLVHPELPSIEVKLEGGNAPHDRDGNLRNVAVQLNTPHMNWTWERNGPWKAVAQDPKAWYVVMEKVAGGYKEVFCGLAKELADHCEVYMPGRERWKERYLLIKWRKQKVVALVPRRDLAPINRGLAAMFQALRTDPK